MSLGLGIGIGAASSVLGGVFGRSSAKKQFQYQKELINMQNEYNSPANQMKRLKEAGLNPNLVYSSGNVVGNQSSTGSAPSVPSVDLTGGISAGLAAYQQVENHDLDMQLKEQAILKSRAEATLMETQAEMERSRLSLDKSINEARSRMVGLQANVMKHNYDVASGKTKGSFIYLNPDIGQSALHYVGDISNRVGGFLGNLFGG